MALLPNRQTAKNPCFSLEGRFIHKMYLAVVELLIPTLTWERWFESNRAYQNSKSRKVLKINTLRDFFVSL